MALASNNPVASWTLPTSPCNSDKQPWAAGTFLLIETSPNFYTPPPRNDSERVWKIFLVISNPVKLDSHCFSFSSTMPAILSLALVNHCLSVRSSVQIKSKQHVPRWRHRPGCSASPRPCQTQEEPTQKHAASCSTGRQKHPRCFSLELAETHTPLPRLPDFLLESILNTKCRKSTWGDRRREGSGS